MNSRISLYHARCDIGRKDERGKRRGGRYSVKSSEAMMWTWRRLVVEGDGLQWASP